MAPPPKPHDGHAGRHAALVGKPFDERRDRRNVTEPKPDTANDAGADPQQPQLMRDDADGADHQAGDPTKRCDEASLSRTRPLEPPAPERRRCAENDEKQCVHPAEIGDEPIAGDREQPARKRRVGAAGHRPGDADGLCERQPENAEAVGHADAEMNGERGRRHQPAIEADFCDGTFAVEDARGRRRHPNGGIG